MNGLIKSNSIGFLKQSIKINSTLIKRVIPISTISTTPLTINNHNSRQLIRNYYDNGNNNEYKTKYVNNKNNNNNNNEWVKGSHFFKTTNELSQSEAYQNFNKRLIDHQTNEINFIRFKEMIDSNSNDTTINFLFGWCTKVIKTKDVNILESFLFYFRKVKSTEFLKVLAYINQNDIPQNIFIFNITLFYYSEMNMIEEAKRLTDLLLSMGSSLPEKAYLAILKTFSTDIDIIKGIEKRIKTDKELGVAPQLYNELIIAYINGHRDLNSALPLLEKLEESNSPVYQSTVITLLNFFINNNMPDRSINLLINVSDKYPSWFAGQSFCEKVAFTCYSLITKLPTLFEHMEKKKTISKVFFNSLIQISSEKSNKEAVIMIYNYMVKHYAPDARTLKDLIYISVKDNNLQECLYWYNTMIELKYTLNSKIASYLIRFFIRTKHFTPIHYIIELARSDRSICSPLTVGIIIYYISYIANTLPGGSAAIASSNKEILNEFIGYIKQQPSQYREEVTDCIIQHCLMEDRLEEAELWFYLKEKQYNIAPSRDTFTNFMAYHIVRSEFKQWNFWKHKMSQYIHTSSNSSSSDTIIEYFRRYYSNPKIGTNLDDRKTNWFDSSVDYVVDGSSNKNKNNGSDGEQQTTFVPPNKSSEIINLVESKKLEMAYEMLYDVVNKGQPIKKNVFGILLNSAIRSNKHKHVKRLYQLFVINSSLMPSFETTLSHLELIYRTNKSDDYQQYVLNPVHGVIPSDFAIANLVILSKYSIKKCIATLSNPENRAYLANDHVRNGFLNGLIKAKDFNRASRLIVSMFDKCPDIYIDPSNLKLYLEKIVEFEYNSPLVNVIINYFQSNRVQFDSRTVNFALASNAYLAGNYTEAYNKILPELQNATFLDATNINFAIKVYAKHFPIPPNHNFKQWQTLQTLAEKFRIPINATYSQMFKCLHDDGRYHIIRKVINSGEIHYFSMPQDAFYYMLHSYKNSPGKLLSLATTALRKDYQIHDNRSKELIKESQKLQPSSSTRIIEYLKICDKYTHNQSTNDLFSFSDQELEFIDHKIIQLTLSQNINYLNKY